MVLKRVASAAFGVTSKVAKTAVGAGAEMAKTVSSEIGKTALKQGKLWIMQKGMTVVTGAELHKPLLGAELSRMAYDAANDSQLQTELDAVGSFDLLHFERQPYHKLQSQWFIARQQDCSALYIVFRGTDSLKDIFTDLSVEPAVLGSSTYHGGFLKMVRDDATLADRVNKAVGASDGSTFFSFPTVISKNTAGAEAPAKIFLCGHSLGGALALTAAGCGLLDGVPTSTSVSVLSYGAPAVFHKDSAVDQRLRNAELLAFINGADAVPRALGADRELLELFLRSVLRVSEPSQASAATVAAIARYGHLPQARLLWLQGGSCYEVPALMGGHGRGDVLDLRASADAGALADHALQRYIDNIRANI